MNPTTVRKVFYGTVLLTLLIIIASIRSDMSATEPDWRRGVFFALIVLIPALVSHSLLERIVTLRQELLLKRVAHSQYTATSKDEAKAIIEYEAITTAQTNHEQLIRALKERYDTAYQLQAKKLAQKDTH